MTGKDKSVEHRHEHAGKKKNMVNQGDKMEEKAVQDAETQEKEKLLEELKAFEEKSNEMQTELKAFEEKSQELHDKYLRLSAEFDNYRKRTLKEKTDLIKTASEDIMIRILPFVDDIERGLKAVNTTQDIEAVKQGMNLIYGRFKDFLQQNGVKEIEALNTEFNTDVHEAVTKIPAPDESQKGKVVDVVEKGYMLHDKVIRYPKVVVGE
ncbi:MAG TPA: nucleotide exchange factor GrpE [Bacteroidales bacterium]|nr:nucleotide exchange factor GrpE [Bacteroidales bacterium]